MARRLAEAEAAGQGMRARLAALTRLNSDLSRSLAGREAGSAAVAALQARTAELEGQLADQSKEVGRLEVCPGITNTTMCLGSYGPCACMSAARDGGGGGRSPDRIGPSFYACGRGDSQCQRVRRVFRSSLQTWRARGRLPGGLFCILALVLHNTSTRAWEPLCTSFFRMFWKATANLIPPPLGLRSVCNDKVSGGC